MRIMSNPWYCNHKDSELIKIFKEDNSSTWSVNKIFLGDRAELFEVLSIKWIVLSRAIVILQIDNNRCFRLWGQTVN